MPQWIKYQLIERPYYDRHGNILSNIEGRTAEFSGGGKVYPDITEHGKIKEWHEKDGILLINIDIPEAEATGLEIKDEKLKYKASPKVEVGYNYKDFKAKVLNDSQAESLKEDFFGIKPLSPESGVTG